MKTTLKILLVGIAAIFCYSIGNAQTIYYNDFSQGGAVNINGTSPTVANNFAGGTSSATWNSVSNSATSYLNSDDTVGTTLGSFLLPFTAQSGYIYTLTASVTLSSMTAGKWITMGFSANDPTPNRNRNLCKSI
jgi:hypothetical protein